MNKGFGLCTRVSVVSESTWYVVAVGVVAYEYLKYADELKCKQIN